MQASDGIAVGQPAISGGYFAHPSFEDQFTAFNASQYSDEMWPTNVGLEGTWHNLYVANDETQKYVAGGQPPPDNWSPYTITPEGLRIRCEEVPSGQDHLDWSRMKKYDPNPDGSKRVTADYPGWPNYQPPWMDRVPVESLDYVLEPYQGDMRVLWRNFPQRWRSGTLTTRDDRASINQGRFWSVVRLPRGSENDGSGRSSFRYRSTSFFAVWVYQMIRRNRGRNNEPRSPGLYQYNDEDGGSLDEIDKIEHGSFDVNRLFHAFHLNIGNKLEQQINYTESAADNARKQTVISTGDLSNEFYVFLLDITREKTGIALGPLGQVPTYRRVITTRRAFYETQRKALLDPTNDRKLRRNSLGDIIMNGEQLYDDGKPRLPDMQLMMTAAADGKWLLEQMSDNPTGAEPPYETLPDGRKYFDTTMKSWGVQPLIGASFIRPSGELYLPHSALAPATTNPWDGAAVSPIPSPVLTGTDG